MGFVEYLTTSIAIPALAEKVINAGIKHRKQEDIERDIKSIITEFDEEFADTIVDGKCFVDYLKQDAVYELMFERVFKAFKNNNKENYADLAEKLANNAVAYINKNREKYSNIPENRVQYYVDYFASQFNRLVGYRESLLNPSESALASVIEDSIADSTDKITEKIDKRFNTIEQKIDNKELKTDPKSIKAAIFEASKLHLAKLKKGRFKKLDIVNSILPLTTGKQHVALKLVSDHDGSMQSINQILINETANCYIIGEGGIGKTTSLVNYAEYFLDGEYNGSNIVPIFIELNKSSDGKDWKKRWDNTEFILHEIHRYFEELETEVTIKKIRKELSKKTAKKEYVLLLDGLNEVSHDLLRDDKPNSDLTIRQAMEEELVRCVKEYSNVRFILTSRKNIAKNFGNLFKYIELYGVTDKTIIAYLKDWGFGNIIDKIKENHQLMHILRVPLFLTRFVAISDKSRLPNITTRGELLYLFYNEITDSFYSQLVRVKETNGIDTISSKRAAVILNILAPEIFYKMKKLQSFGLNKYLVDQIINGAFKKYTTELDALTVNQTFDKVIKAKTKRTTTIIDKMHDDVGVDAIRTFVIENLCLLNIDGDNLTVTHHYYRDYFASVYYINTMRLAFTLFKNNEQAIAIDLLTDSFDKLISDNLLTLIIEILGEAQNKPIFDEQLQKVVYNVPQNGKTVENEYRQLLTNLLDVFRGKRYSEDDSITHYPFVNVFEMLKKGRIDLSGEDFSDIDFKGCKFYGAYYGTGFLERVDSNGNIVSGANFNESKLYNSNFYSGHQGNVTSAVYSTDGKKILSASNDGTIKEWSVKSGEIIQSIVMHRGWINTAVYSQDGKKILSASNDGAIKEWDVKSGNIIQSYAGDKKGVISAVYSEDGNKILSTSRDGTIKEWDVTNGEIIRSYDGHRERVISAIYSPDGKKVLSASFSDGNIKEWDVTNGTVISSYYEHNYGVVSAVYSPDGQKILSVSVYGVIKEREIASGEILFCYTRHQNGVDVSGYNSAIYSEDGKKILSVFYDGVIIEWDVKSGNIIRKYTGHQNLAKLAVYSPDGNKILVIFEDDTITEMNVESGEIIRNYIRYSTDVCSAVYSEDGKKILSASWDRTIKEWDLESGGLLHIFVGHQDAVTSAVYSADGKKLLSASDDGTIKEWDVKSGEVICDYIGHQDDVISALYSEDGKKILSVSRDRSIKEWDVSNGKILQSYVDDKKSVKSAVYSPDSKKILSTYFDSRVVERDVESGKIIRQYTSNANWFISAVYSHDGKKILSTNIDGWIIEWGVESGDIIREYPGDTVWVRSVMYSQNGKKMLSAYIDGTLKEWDVEKGKAIRSCSGYKSGLTSAVYSKDSYKILSSHFDGTINEWDAKSGENTATMTNTPFNLVKCNFTNINSDDLTKHTLDLIKQSGGIL